MKIRNILGALSIGALLSVQALAQRYEVVMTYDQANATNPASLTTTLQTVQYNALLTLSDAVYDSWAQEYVYFEAGTGTDRAADRNTAEAYFNGIYSYVLGSTGSVGLAQMLSNPFCLVSHGQIEQIVGNWGEGGGYGGFNPN